MTIMMASAATVSKQEEQQDKNPKNESQRVRRTTVLHGWGVGRERKGPWRGREVDGEWRREDRTTGIRRERESWFL